MSVFPTLTPARAWGGANPRFLPNKKAGTEKETEQTRVKIEICWSGVRCSSVLWAFLMQTSTQGAPVEVKDATTAPLCKFWANAKCSKVQSLTATFLWGGVKHYIYDFIKNY